MKKVVLLLVFLFSFGFVSAEDCVISLSCSGATPYQVDGLYFYGQSNTHTSSFEDASYAYKLCCAEDVNFQVSSNVLIALYSTYNSHVAVPVTSEDGFHVLSNCPVNNRYELTGSVCQKGSSDCTASQFCLLTYSDSLNAHISSCDVNPYSNKICCVPQSSFICNDDGILDPENNEQCDGSDFGLSGGSNLCVDYSSEYESGTLSCNNCVIDFSNCDESSGAECGDGTLDPSEDCEESSDCGSGQQCVDCVCYDDEVPIAGPDEYIVWGDCEPDPSNPNSEYGTVTWQRYDSNGLPMSGSDNTGVTACVLDIEEIPLFGYGSFMLFLVILGMFYYSEMFKSKKVNGNREVS